MTAILLAIVVFLLFNNDKYKAYEKTNAHRMMYVVLIFGFAWFANGLLRLDASISAGGIILIMYAFYLWYKYPVSRR